MISNDMTSEDTDVAPKKPRKEHLFSEPWDDSDVILVVEDEKFHVHSAILGLASPVFKAMFSSDFKEGIEKQVNLQGKKKSDVLKMLEIIYPIEDKTKVYSFASILELAREYEIKRVTQCIENEMDQEKCSTINLNIAEQFSLKKTYEKHIKYYAEEYCFSRNPWDWNSVSAEVKLEIFCARVKHVFNLSRYNMYCQICKQRNPSCDHPCDKVSWSGIRSLIQIADFFGNKN